MLKSHDFTDRCVTDSAHLPRYPSFLFCVEKDELTRLRRDGLEPSTLAYEASKLPLLYPAVGVVGLGPTTYRLKADYSAN